ncbi:helix-turn-helix domain-containing protein [Streptomyces endophytica]|uniref:LuxR C-terminal-related transcriptional regulator n=1 Tax=Streptomyces endophytica TaxID=2991496 RepID=A0ABY6PK50_9ACTN|nr:LuxR C-terminal-related transcriptional regulator [Streptomyces endophytica]UZJ33522.1 LuxR C-terminal-related transcriptional regulator [Streptomyces endophytica]
MPVHSPPALLSLLTPRETEVLGLVADGLGNSEIAARIGLAEDTIKGYLRSIRTKLGMSRRPVLADMACRAGHAARPKGAEAVRPEVSDAEKTTLRLLAQGAGAREVAKAQLMSHHTAKKHNRQLLDKMGASDAVHGVSLAWSWQFFNADEGARA